MKTPPMIWDPPHKLPPHIQTHFANTGPGRCPDRWTARPARCPPRCHGSSSGESSSSIRSSACFSRQPQRLHSASGGGFSVPLTFLLILHTTKIIVHPIWYTCTCSSGTPDHLVMNEQLQFYTMRYNSAQRVWNGFSRSGDPPVIVASAGRV